VREVDSYPQNPHSFRLDTTLTYGDSRGRSSTFTSVQTVLRTNDGIFSLVRGYRFTRHQHSSLSTVAFTRESATAATESQTRRIKRYRWIQVRRRIVKKIKPTPAMEPVLSNGSPLSWSYQN